MGIQTMGMVVIKIVELKQTGNEQEVIAHILIYE